MNVALAIFGGLLGLFITGAAVYTAWMVRQLWKQQEAQPKPATQAEVAAGYLSRWTVLDYSVVGLFLIGLLLLLADLLAVMRDKAAFPDYHFLYLLSGIVISAMGMLLLFVRLLVVLGIAKSSTLERPVTPNHHHEPSHTDQTE